jgi:hypothetical protein
VGVAYGRVSDLPPEIRHDSQLLHRWMWAHLTGEHARSSSVATAWWRTCSGRSGLKLSRLKSASSTTTSCEPSCCGAGAASCQPVLGALTQRESE